MEPASQCYRDAMGPIVPQQELQVKFEYGHSRETARDNLEEGGDDVKSSCPL